MRRHLLWFVLAALWGAIAVTSALHHRGGTAALEGLFALMFAGIGVAVKRRDDARGSRYTARRPR